MDGYAKRSDRSIWQHNIGELPFPQTRLHHSTIVRAGLLTKRQIEERKNDQKKKDVSTETEEELAEGTQQELFIPPPIPQEYVDLGMELQQQTTATEEILMSPQVVIMDESPPSSGYTTPLSSVDYDLIPSTSQCTTNKQADTRTVTLNRKKQTTTTLPPIHQQTKASSTNHNQHDKHIQPSNVPKSLSSPQFTCIPSTSQNSTNMRTVLSPAESTDAVTLSTRRLSTKRHKAPRVDLDDSSDDSMEITITKGTKKWCATLKKAQQNQ